MDELQSGAEPPAVAKTSGMAIASLVLGICGFCTAGISALIGLILGIIGLSAINKSAGHLKGQGIAIAGIVVSGTSLVLVPLTILLMANLTPALSRARTHARTAVTMNNARQLCLAISMYCDENAGHFPPADSWPATLAPYIGGNKTILTSPFDPDAGRAWAMNANLEGRKTKDIEQPHRTVLIFEARLGSPPAGGPELLPEKPPGRRSYVIGFVDGHVECDPPRRLDELIWDPSIQAFEVLQ